MTHGAPPKEPVSLTNLKVRLNEMTEQTADRVSSVGAELAALEEDVRRAEAD